MAGEVYGNFEFALKSYTRGTDVGKGQIGLPHLDPPLFLEMRLVKTHTHTGVDSQALRSEATPEMVRGYKTREREERGVATWTGGASAAGSINLTYGTAFSETPTIMVTCAAGTANIQVSVGSVTATGCIIYWKDDTAATHSSVAINYLIKGR
jgi:hypothetical protein